MDGDMETAATRTFVSDCGIDAKSMASDASTTSPSCGVTLRSSSSNSRVAIDVLVFRSENVTTRFAVAVSPNHKDRLLVLLRGKIHDRTIFDDPAILALKSDAGSGGTESEDGSISVGEAENVKTGETFASWSSATSR